MRYKGLRRLVANVTRASMVGVKLTQGQGDVRWRPSSGLIHSALMRVKYSLVSQRKLWHILRLFHRLHMNMLLGSWQLKLSSKGLRIALRMS